MRLLHQFVVPPVVGVFTVANSNNVGITLYIYSYHELRVVVSESMCLKRRILVIYLLNYCLYIFFRTLLSLVDLTP